MENEITPDSKPSANMCNPLAILWKSLMATLAIRDSLWKKLLDAYLDTPGNMDIKTSKNKSTTKLRITSQLSETVISWNSLVRGLRILRFTRGTIIFRGWIAGRSKPIEVSSSFTIGTGYLSVDETDVSAEDEFFISNGHRLAFILLHTDGRVRMDSLDVTDIHYASREKANAWKKSIKKSIMAEKDLSTTTKKLAIEKLNELTNRMLGDENECS